MYKTMHCKKDGHYLNKNFLFCCRDGWREEFCFTEFITIRLTQSVTIRHTLITWAWPICWHLEVVFCSPSYLLSKSKYKYWYAFVSYNCMDSFFKNIFQINSVKAYNKNVEKTWKVFPFREHGVRSNVKVSWC